MKSRFFTVLVGMLLIVSVVLTGCAQTPADNPDANGAVPAEEDGDSPAAPSGKTLVLKGQMHNLPGNPFYDNFERMCADITLASQGQLEMKPFGGGTVVPSIEEFDGVDSGVLDFALNNSFYWMNHFQAAGLFAYRTGGMAPMEFLAWMNTGGGAELMDTMVDGYNVHVIAGGGNLCTPEIFLSSDKDLNTAADIDGLKVRAGGDGGEVLSMMGASVVLFPSDEIYESMQRGVIDAYECSNPTVNCSMGMQEVGKNVYLSGSRQPMEYLPFFFNKDVWNDLSPELQKLVEEITRAGAVRLYTQLVKADTENIQVMIDYGNNVQFLPADIDQAVADTADQLYAEKAAGDAFFKDVFDSQLAFQTQVRQAFSRL
ncbi:MAG: hypothetical protein JW846_07935 [Dehalococcoidia bacterium]|nr:hypothetical protein [Dehalococcoidia bacterium]